MLHAIAQAASQILAEIGGEIASSPLRFVAEIAQFALLVVIAWAVTLGFGKRRGFVANMLSERREALTVRIGRALDASETLAGAKRDAEKRLRSARAEARRILDEAGRDAEQSGRDACAQADTEAELVASRAASALQTERDEMQSDMRETLIDVVASATRSILDEQMTVSEQRELIESTIASSVPSQPRAASASAGKVAE
jgi:F-type H+-transporting ATPase subunit b